MQRLGLAYLSRDRLDYTRRTIGGADIDDADLLWIDDSTSDESRAWGAAYQPRHPRSFARTRGAGRGAAEAIKEALALLERHSDAPWLGYAENDILLEPGWWDACLRAVDAAQSAGFRVGAVSPLSPRSRALTIAPEFAPQWIAGQVIVFRREYVEDVRERWDQYVTLRALSRWARRLGCSLDGPYFRFTRFHAGIGGMLPGDWAVVPALAQNGLACIGTVPGMASDLDRPHEAFGDRNVTHMDSLASVLPEDLAQKVAAVAAPRLRTLSGPRWAFRVARGRTWGAYLAHRSRTHQPRRISPCPPS